MGFLLPRVQAVRTSVRRAHLASAFYQPPHQEDDQMLETSAPYRFPRFNVMRSPSGSLNAVPADRGRWVDAVEAICREAALTGRIRELEQQLRALSAKQRWQCC